MRVNLKNISKTFHTLHRQTVAVDDISLEINDKEFFVLLGPSGCGKSTLLNIIAGLEKQDSGEIKFDNTMIASSAQKHFLTPKERNIAMVFQSYALYPHLNVYENIAFPLRIAKINDADIDKTVKKAAETLHLTPLLHSKPKELSGGQRQRVAIARAIVRKPNVLLFDEPLSNLDAKLRSTMRAELKNLQNTLGITTIYVTHDQIEAMTLGNRIAVLNNGKIEQIGTPNELYEQPSNIFVASFIGTPSMNLLPAEVVKKEGNKVLIQCGPMKFTVDSSKLPSPTTTKVTLGIRPEHIILNSTEKDSFEAEVNSIEYLGKENLVHLKLDKIEMKAVTTDKNIKEKNNLRISYNNRIIQIFS